ncbi:MAG: molybdenum ABC transporter ATP-binding protein [Ketobacteraceae bacterium]|nr:molybdenum ABC transporter ATP-binding protein [Ketobacteraceae bacterium]
MDVIQLTARLQRQDFHLDVDVQVPGEGVTAVFGPSGSGKTTLLRIVAGLEKAPRSSVVVGGHVWQGPGEFLPVHHRPLGYVFQEPSLFPHLTARGNLHYAMKRSRPASDRTRYQQIVDMLGIGPLLDRRPAQLSGGEQQRVAIARALLVNPAVLLMDEPLASLDHARKQEILPYLERLKSDLSIPILYVSHSASEIARIADHLLALDNGRAVANGPLLENLSRLDFPLHLGEDTGVVIEARVAEKHTRWHLAKVAFPGGELWVRDNDIREQERVRVRVLARDISLALTHHEDSSIVNILAGTVDAIVDDLHPAMALVRVKVESTLLIARITRRSVHHLALVVGQSVWVQVKSAALVR